MTTFTLGRARIFHGVNVVSLTKPNYDSQSHSVYCIIHWSPLTLPFSQVYKSFPYYPTNGSFDAEYSFNSDDIAMLVEYGFTVVRLYVAWPGVEPSKGNYNATYLDTLYKIIDQLGKSGIYTILDCHQDLWSPKFCGTLNITVRMPYSWNILVTLQVKEPQTMQLCT